MARAKENTGESSGFEADLEQLEKIVQALEEGGLSLEEALKQFEMGVQLARRCEGALTEAEKKIEMLMRNAQGEMVAVPFDAECPPAENEVVVEQTTVVAQKTTTRREPPAAREVEAHYEEDELPF